MEKRGWKQENQLQIKGRKEGHRNRMLKGMDLK